MEKIFENFTISILKLNKLVNKIKAYEMKEYGLKAVHVMCVYYLSENPQGLKFSELVKLTLEDKAAVSRALTLLYGKGYVNYDRNKYNADINLTQEGLKVAAFIEEKSVAAVEAGSAVLREEERILFYKSLNTIAENLSLYYKNLKNEKNVNIK